MRRFTFTIDETTEKYMDILIDAFGMSKVELIRRAVDCFYWDQKEKWPGAIEESIVKLKEG